MATKWEYATLQYMAYPAAWICTDAHRESTGRSPGEVFMKLGGTRDQRDPVFVDLLNLVGQLGWELVNWNEEFEKRADYIFKRAM